MKRNQKGNRIKKFITVTLAVLLVISGLQVGVKIVDASTDNNIKIETVAALSKHNNSGYAKITLVTDTTFTSGGNISGLENLISFEGMDDIVKRAGSIYGYAVAESKNIWLMFDGVSFDDVSVIPESAKITFTPGTITHADGTSYYLTNSNTLTYHGEGWSENEDISITSVSVLSGKNGTAKINLTTDATFTSDGNISGLKDLIAFEGMGDIITSGIYGIGLNASGTIWLMFDGVSYSEGLQIPEGAKITFTPGTITHTSGTSYYLTNSNTLTYHEGEWTENEDISITSVSVLSGKNGTAKINLTTDATFTSDGNISGLKDLIAFEGMGDIITSGIYGIGLNASGTIWLMFDGVSYSEGLQIPEGAKITFTPGIITHADGTSYYLTNSNTLTYHNGVWAEYKDIEVREISVLSRHNSGNAKINLTTDVTFAGDGTVSGLKDLITFEGMDNIDTSQMSVVALNNTSTMWLVFEGVTYNEELTIPEGAKITFKSGVIKHSNGTSYILANTNTLTYRSGVWAEYKDITITNVSALSKHNSGNAKINLTADVTFAGDGTVSGLKDLITFEGMDNIDVSQMSVVALNNTSIMWLVFEGVTYSEELTIPEGAKITFKSGVIKHSNGTSYYLGNTNTLTYRSGVWGEYKDIEVTEVSVLSRHNSGNAKINLTTDVTFAGDGTVSGLKNLITFEGMDNIDTSSVSLVALKDTGTIWMVFNNVSYSEELTIPEGAKITFTPGAITHADGTFYYLTNMNTLTYRNGKWVTDIEITTVGSLSKHNGSGYAKITLVTNTTFKSDGIASGLKDLISFKGMNIITEKANSIYGFAEGNKNTIFLMFDGVLFDDVSSIPTGATLTFTPGMITHADGICYYLTNDCTYIYNGANWQLSDEDVYFEWTNLWGDANADGAMDVRDLIRVKKYINRESNKVPICLEGANVIADDATTINTEDLNELRLMLIGAPQLEMAAYDGPGYRHSTTTASTWITEADLKDYMNCGFTYLFPEEDAWYMRYYNYEEGEIAATTDWESCDLYRFMEIAERANIPVVIGSPDIVAEIREDSTDDIERSTALKNMITSLAKYRMFKGITLCDEPNIQELSRTKVVKDFLDGLKSDLFYFTSNHPIYGPSISMLTTDTTVQNKEYAYKSYVDEFSTACGSFVYDSYPLLYSESGTGSALETSWFQNLEIVAASAKTKNYDAGITIQSVAYNPETGKHNRPITTKADVGFQMYTALAYGMKNVNYYTYYATEGTTGLYSAMVNFKQDGTKEKTAAYNAVREINWEIRKFDHILLAFEWEGTMAVGKDSSDVGSAFYSVGNYSDSRISTATSTQNAIIGCMQNSVGQNGYMVVNATDPGLNQSNNVTVTFAGAKTATAYVNGKEQKITLSEGSYTFALESGQGVFVVLD